MYWHNRKRSEETLTRSAADQVPAVADVWGKGKLARPADPPDHLMRHCIYDDCSGTVWLQPYEGARNLECKSCSRPWYRLPQWRS